MAAISDAAKLGVSTRESTLYSTLYPCHICAKDVISAGIEKVFFLEEYPKSKNSALYSEIIEINPKERPNKKLGFYIFTGVGPSAYSAFYSLENIKSKLDKDDPYKNPLLLKHRPAILYKEAEKNVDKLFPEYREEDSKK